MPFIFNIFGFYLNTCTKDAERTHEFDKYEPHAIKYNNPNKKS